VRINHVDGNPSDAYTVVDNTIVRDAALSLRSRGLMVLLLSHNTGFELNSVGISKQATEGRDAVRTAMSELEAAGYLRHVQYRQEGKWFTRLDVYRHRNAPEQARGPENPASESQAPVRETRPGFSGAGKSGVIKKTNEEDQQESKSPSSGDGGAVSDSTTEEAVSHDGAAREFPMWARAALESVPPQQRTQWERAWRAICSLVDTHWDPNLHLTKYLARCTELKREPTPSDWTRWFAEDEKDAADKAAQQRKAKKDNPTHNPYWE
jgi:hypothetical protein